MTDISAFPTLPRANDSELISDGGPILTFIASGTILVGQAVCYAATGVSMTVLASVAGENTKPVGVALNNATNGEYVAVAMAGCVVEMANADNTATIDAGHWVECNDNPVGGTINEIDFTASGATVTIKDQTIGMALDDIAASGTGRVLVMPIPLTVGNAS
ncbi:MAG TPA: DUF2190 family protein [Methanospirillum sp.]|uniref:capsid cement protein n=1 Tax=Methanospirillum sp. TaxID=45200 RepID=UPI002C18A17E|nr:capsid cement protein [Methanospirillum sp.]HPY61094.1 DUF2190 family protein [Methanospirillum sp.]